MASINMSAADKGGIFADLAFLTKGLELRAGAGEGVGVRVLDADDRL